MKRLISFLLAIVLICSSLPMCVGAEETTGGYKLEYERIGEDTYKIYIIGEKLNAGNEFRLYYNDVEVVSYQWNKEVSEGNFAASISSDVIADKYVVFCCATVDEKGLEVDAGHIAEVVIKTNSVNQTVSLVDGISIIKYDEITLDNMTPILSPTPEVSVSVLPTETLVPTPGPNRELGDVDGNGSINAQDALAVLKHAAKIFILPDESVCEVTGDGLVNAQDALEILRFAAHIIDGFGKNDDVVIPTMNPESAPTPVPAGPITYDKESDTYTMHGNGMAYVEGQKVPNGYYELKNPFSGLDLNEGLVINQFDRPVWNKGVTISFWVKVPTTEVDSDKDAVVLSFSLPEHIVVDENDLTKYYLCKAYNKNDEAYSMGTTETYVAVAEDGTETEYTVLNGYGNKVRYNPNYPEEGCYSLKTDNDAVYAIKKGADPMLEENWVTIGFIGEGLYDDYSKRYFEKGGENSKIMEVNTTSRLNIFASGSVEFMEDDGTGYQLNPNAEDYLKSHKNTNNNNYGMQANNNPANGFSLSKNPTPETVTNYDQWRFMVVSIANDGVTVYSDGEKLIEEYYSYCGTAMKDAYKIFENSFNKGYGPSFSMINWGLTRAKLDGLTLMELISDENTILEIGGQTNDYGRSIKMGDKVINSIELVGTPEGTQVKNVKFYDTIISEENIKADRIINEKELIVNQIKTEVSL